MRNLMDIVSESFSIYEIDADRAYEIFRQSYEAETGAAWDKAKFLSRARNWTFYGDENGYVAVRVQNSGMKKLVGVAGNPRSILRGIEELTHEGGAIWGAVSDKLARVAQKHGMIAPHLLPGGKFFLKALVKMVPFGVFGGVKPEITSDGGMVFNYEDVGPATKYFIANREYFKTLARLPQAQEMIGKVPGMTRFVKFVVGESKTAYHAGMRDDELYEEHELFDMANLTPKRTGLPFVVWISPRNAPHSARVKVSQNARARRRDMISVTINDPIKVKKAAWPFSSEEFEMLKAWIMLNRDVLNRYWDGDLEDTGDVLAMLKPIRRNGDGAQ